MLKTFVCFILVLGYCLFKCTMRTQSLFCLNNDAHEFQFLTSQAWKKLKEMYYSKKKFCSYTVIIKRNQKDLIFFPKPCICLPHNLKKQYHRFKCTLPKIRTQVTNSIITCTNLCTLISGKNIMSFFFYK